jgi:hypothetical protein
MIIWKGWGILVFVMAVVALVIAHGIAEAASGNPQYYATHNWVKCLAFLAAAVPVYFIGRNINNKPVRILIDKTTKREIVLRREHSLFFIRMEYWAFILVAIGILHLFIHPHIQQ